ncbi:MAG: LTA synthase family protein [Opitutaceae bacterium]|jgi:phosphoglycerol transferase MdoB-like AlkP superfamily enzyme|nr:LTA synthase family protein [Opitutaceae bacterium]
MTENKTFPHFIPLQQKHDDEAAPGGFPRKGRRSFPFAFSLLVTVIVAALLVFVVEVVARGSFRRTLPFFLSTWRPWWTTILLFALLLSGLDALLGRAHHALLVIAPLMVLAAWLCHQKTLYLGDPLYPTDFLYVRQVLDLMPLLARDRPGAVAAAALGLAGGVVFVVLAWVFWRRRFPLLPMRHRAVRLLIALPVPGLLGLLMDYSSYSRVRDRLNISPMMWDQKENYSHNGFTLAFALNLPMARLSAPAGYSEATIHALTLTSPGSAPAAPAATPATVPAEPPDIIIVMNESFWDSTRLPGVTLEPDPVPTVRALLSGHVFSPEFGGMTSNVEFEALTGFSNAFLPCGSIPYQQYIRGPVPSLARFLKERGYATCALHPNNEWFWNRKAVYTAFGFDEFLSGETLPAPALEKRGPLASDAALTEEIIRRAGRAEEPFFFFAVTLQNHGPYEPHRYPDNTIRVETSADEETRESIASYAEGTADGDRGLARLVEWARGRQRETIIVFFGDHLPPLGPVYVNTGFMPGRVASRDETPDDMTVQHETPLVIWSSRTGPAAGVGTISPALLPLQVLRAAGITHPWYTGFLGAVRERYRVIDRNLLMAADDTPSGGPWQREEIDPVLAGYRQLQYDMMFGEGYAASAWFPEMQATPAPIRISGCAP